LDESPGVDSHFHETGVSDHAAQIAAGKIAIGGQLPRVESQDGRNWKRKMLGLAEFGGSRENIRRFAILEKELDHDDGELTATQKVRRAMIEKKFARELAIIYQAEG